MPGQRGISQIGLIAIVLLLIVLGGLYFLQNKNIPDSQVAAKNEWVLIKKGNSATDDYACIPSYKTYEINLLTKETRPYTKNEDIYHFDGLPKEQDGNKTKIILDPALFSKDKTQVILRLFSYDSTQEINDEDCSSVIQDVKEYLCLMATKKCSTSSVLEEKAGQEYPIWWRAWDSQKNLLFGHISGEGLGNSSPVFIYDITTKTVRQTVGYGNTNERDSKTWAKVLPGAFSPSLSKFVIVDFLGKKIVLFNSSDLSQPARSYYFSLLDSKIDGISSTDWSPDETQLSVGTDNKIYILDLKSGQFSLKYTDLTQGRGALYWDRNTAQFSPSGRFIYFVDYEGYTDDPTDEWDTIDILKAIDLNNSDKIIEITRAPYLSISTPNVDQ